MKVEEGEEAERYRNGNGSNSKSRSRNRSRSRSRSRPSIQFERHFSNVKIQRCRRRLKEIKGNGGKERCGDAEEGSDDCKEGARVGRGDRCLCLASCNLILMFCFKFLD